MDPAYLSHLEYMHMFRPDLAAAAAAAASANTSTTSTSSTSPTTTNTTSSNPGGSFKLPISGLIKPPNPQMDHILGLRQQLLSAASIAAASASSPAVSPQTAKNSSPASSLERPRSPIDLDDTSEDATSVTSPKSLSGSSASAFRQVKPNLATSSSQDSDKKDKSVWRPYWTCVHIDVEYLQKVE